MFHPLELSIGLRYVRSRRRRGVVSFMSGASLVGIALGVAALIVILSVMNGLETELRSLLVALTAPASVSSPEGLENWRGLQQWLGEQPHVQGAAPYVTIEGMLASGEGLMPVVVRGVLPAQEQRIDQLGQRLRLGSLDALQPGSRRIVLERVLALNLGVQLGDTVRLLVPKVEHGRTEPELVGFTVAGVFDAGIQDYTNLAFVDLEDASRLKGLAGRPEGLAVRLDDALAVDQFHREVAPRLAAQHLKYSDWTEEHAAYFHATRVEKTMMTIILMFIVGVAAFNIVASLMMVVTDKEKDIAILRTCGLEPGRVAKIFLIQGSVIGLAGTLIGTLVGVLLALNVGTIVPWLEDTFHFQIFPADVYYVTQVPSEVHVFDVTVIPVVAFLLTVLATLYPSRRAAGVSPAEALRYE
ncbi:MAG TPA: lipoprotein-releasing ABC transporter permease subunit [Gammaproteobacteria bacterium]|nr:lipoprotein-releasing ABC transporter permease subunit [Gammaproteobacteria bacterium]